MKNISTFLLIFILCLASFSLLAQHPQLIIQRGHTAPITDAIISNQLQLAVTQSFDRTLKVWSLTNGRELVTFPISQNGFKKTILALHPNQTTAFFVDADGSLHLIDLQTIERQPLTLPFGVSIAALSVHPNKNILIVGTENGKIFNYNWTTQSATEQWAGTGSPIIKIESLHTQPSAETLAIQTQTDEFFILKHNGNHYTTVISKNPINDFDIDNQQKRIIIASNDSLVSMIDNNNFGRQRTFAIPHKIRSIYSHPTQKDFAIFEDLSDFQLKQIHLQTGEITPIPLQLARYYMLKIIGDQLVYNENATLKIASFNDLQKPQTLAGYVGDAFRMYVGAMTFDASGRNIITSSAQQDIQFWGDVDNATIDTDYEVNALNLSPSGRYLMASGGKASAYLIDLQSATPSIIQTISDTSLKKKNAIYPRFIDDTTFISLSEKNPPRIWTISQDQPAQTVNAIEVEAHQIRLDQPQRLFALRGIGHIYIYDCTNPQQPLKVTLPSPTQAYIYTLQFVHEHPEWLILGRDDGKIDIWNWQTNEILHSFHPFDGAISSMVQHKGKWFISSGLPSGDSTTIIAVYDAETHQLHSIFEGHAGGVAALAVSQDGRFLASSGNDNTIKLWRVADQTLLATKYMLSRNDWAWRTPNGLFDASPDAMYLMHYAYAAEVIQLQQLKQRYYEPNLLQKLLGYNPEPIRKPEVFQTIELYPLARLQLDTNTLELHIRLQPRNGGIGKVSVFINNKEVIEDANPKRATDFKINLKPYKKYFLQDTSNHIHIKTYNKKGWLHSSEYGVSYQYRMKEILNKGINKNKKTSATSRPLLYNRQPQPRFFALVIGTSNYRGDAMDLTYADKDAADIANALQLSANVLFGDDNTAITLLTSNASGEAEATKNNIINAFQNIAQAARAEDVFMLYLSGHGVNYADGGQSKFYYLTKGMASEDLSDENIRQLFALSSSELTTHLQTIAANKQIMVLDACSSGSLVNDWLANTRSISSSQKRALDRMKDRTGVFILAGSAANKVSYEASQFGQGLLTYSLLSGMRGGSLREGEYVDVMQLFQYVADRVPKLAAFVGGVQRPVIAAPRGSNSFDFGQITDSVRYQIPLQSVKPIFVQSNFQEATTFEDVLDVATALDARLTTIGADKDASILFVNVKKYPTAYSVKGRYTISNDKIIVKANILQDKNIILQLEIEASNVDDFIDQLLDAVADGL